MMSSCSINSEVSLAKNEHPKDDTPTEVLPSKDDSFSLSSKYSEVDRWRNQKESTQTVLLPGHQCPSFITLAVMEDGETTEAFSDSDFQSNYVVFFFFPMDRSVDYSELMAFKEHVELFEDNDCQVVGVTSDSLISILGWIKMEPKQGGTGGPVNFTILSDENKFLAKMFGVKRPSGMPSRATFILDKERKVRHCSVYPRVVARSVEEVLRTLQAIQLVDMAFDLKLDVCVPAGWKEGEEAIINTSEGIQEFYSKIRVVESPDDANVGEENKTDESGKSVTVTAGPEVSCPVNNWFYKIPNQETLDREWNYFQ